MGSKFISESRYTRLVARTKEALEPRIMAILSELKAATEKAGFVCTDWDDFSGDEYAWGMGIDLFPAEGGDPYDDSTEAGWTRTLDVTFYLLESLAREGNLDGVAFGLSSCYRGGRIGGPSMTPGNYSEELWIPVYMSGKVAERLGLFDGQADEFVYCVEQARDEVAGERPVPA